MILLFSFTLIAVFGPKYITKSDTIILIEMEFFFTLTLNKKSRLLLYLTFSFVKFQFNDPKT